MWFKQALTMRVGVRSRDSRGEVDGEIGQEGGEASACLRVIRSSRVSHNSTNAPRSFIYHPLDKQRTW